MARIIETRNFGSDYPDEKLINLPRMTKEHAKEVVKAINAGFPTKGLRYWMEVDDDYVPQTSLEI